MHGGDGDRCSLGEHGASMRKNDGRASAERNLADGFNVNIKVYSRGKSRSADEGERRLHEDGDVLGECRWMRLD